MAFSLRSLEANKREALSLSLRLRDARARATGGVFGICPVLVKLLSSDCSVSIQCILEADSDGVLPLWTSTLLSNALLSAHCSAARLLRDVHAGRTAIAFFHRPVVWFTSSISEVSRFSCIEFLDVRGVYDYAGPARSSRYRSRSCCLPLCRQRRRPDCNFSKLDTQPIYAPVYASVGTSRCILQNSGPSGALLLPRKALSSSTLWRFERPDCGAGSPCQWPIATSQRHCR